ncbi:MAG: DNA topoisomerase IV subunit B [Alphaproteobacteria bacterium]|nr:DNA topoisomerase IV subunit B [Alphaproteobacteria bacterium]
MATKSSRAEKTYDASSIEVLEGLEPVRRRPGMYIGGTDERAMHHLVAEVLDNAMDEAVAGHATRIDIALQAGNRVVIRDNGRGIPVDPHPKYKNKSALEVILTTLHSGGKFSGKAYETSGGLHGVGISVVNALSSDVVVEVARQKQLYRQTYSQGAPTSKLLKPGSATWQGTQVSFVPDTEIFGRQTFKPATLFRLARSKAYLFAGVSLHWHCDAALIDDDTPAEAVLHFPGGMQDFLRDQLAGRETLSPDFFAGRADLPEGVGTVEWAVAWPEQGQGFCHSYCNTIPTPQGGTHENGLRTALLKSLRAYGERAGNKKIGALTSDEAFADAVCMLSLFIREPQFQGQTKDKLATAEAARWVENVIKDHADHWLADHPANSNALLEALIDKAEARARDAQDKELSRKTATRKLRLPGKLADCSRSAAAGTELFLVEGDSAGGSAKQARARETQAILPLRGKILNVASASGDKLRQNQELADLVQALGCGIGNSFDVNKLRYERVIIMTDADVDGAHIAALLMTFFYTEMPQLIEKGHLYLAQPPLYRLSAGGESVYARNDAHRDELLATVFKGRTKVETSRFKGLGEMLATQLRDTTMDPARRNLLRVVLRDKTDADDAAHANSLTAELVESLMGKKAEKRFAFIQENARFVKEVDV